MNDGLGGIKESFGEESDAGTAFWKVCDTGLPAEKSRLHSQIDGRFITIFRQNGKLSAIDSVCYHAGGPLTLGSLQDIEDLDGITTVSCPWHKFLVSIDDGSRVYQQVTIVDGKPSVKGWTKGKVVQRTHKVYENDSGVYVVSRYNMNRTSSHVFTMLSIKTFPVVYNIQFQSVLTHTKPSMQALQITSDAVQSDKDAKNAHCVRDFVMHPDKALLNNFPCPTR
jgi:nitrite reductase/ring-hydroxylating ferredoxin subunit